MSGDKKEDVFTQQTFDIGGMHLRTQELTLEQDEALAPYLEKLDLRATFGAFISAFKSSAFATEEGEALTDEAALSKISDLTDVVATFAKVALEEKVLTKVLSHILVADVSDSSNLPRYEYSPEKVPDIEAAVKKMKNSMVFRVVTDFFITNLVSLTSFISFLAEMTSTLHGVKRAAETSSDTDS